jgi:2-C-methyl-D-erythritol 4-phosphate cytidylyltransferase
VPLAGRPMVEWSAAAMAAAGLEVVRVVPAGYAGVTGGSTRSASVLNGLRALPADVDVVVVHDAARPLAPVPLFAAVVEALRDADGAVAAARVSDTVREVDGMVSIRTLDRSRLWAIQTPQAFRRDVLERALDAPDEVLAAATDDAWLVERAGGRVVVVEAPARNFKVTTPDDLELASLLLG